MPWRLWNKAFSRLAGIVRFAVWMDLDIVETLRLTPWTVGDARERGVLERVKQLALLPGLRLEPLGERVLALADGFRLRVVEGFGGVVWGVDSWMPKMVYYLPFKSKSAFLHLMSRRWMR